MKLWAFLAVSYGKLFNVLQQLCFPNGLPAFLLQKKAMNLISQTLVFLFITTLDSKTAKHGPLYAQSLISKVGGEITEREKHCELLLIGIEDVMDHCMH